MNTYTSLLESYDDTWQESKRSIRNMPSRALRKKTNCDLSIATMEFTKAASEIRESEAKQITISLAIAEQWQKVGKDRTLNTDSEIASFLLQLYSKANGQTDASSISCISCKKILSVALCPQCAIFYNASSGSNLESARHASSSLNTVVKTEKRDGSSDDDNGLIKVHFEDVGIQTDQQLGETTNIQRNCRLVEDTQGTVSGRRRGRPPKKHIPPGDSGSEPKVCSASLVPSLLPLAKGYTGKKRGRKPKHPAPFSNSDSDTEPEPHSFSPLSPSPPLRNAHTGNRRGHKPKQTVKIVLQKTERVLTKLRTQKTNKISQEKQKVTSKQKLSVHNQAVNSYLHSGKISKRAESEDSDQSEDEEQNRLTVYKPALSASNERKEKRTTRKEKSGDKKGTAVRKGRKGGVHPCDMCDSVFKEPYLLKRHKAIHSEDHGKDWEYHCQQCTRSFKKKGALDAHLRTHSGQKLFICAVCDLPFALTKQLKKHIQCQHGDVASTMACYKCSQCQCTFVRDRKLYIHVYRHTVEKKYQCEVAIWSQPDTHLPLLTQW